MWQLLRGIFFPFNRDRPALSRRVSEVMYLEQPIFYYSALLQSTQRNSQLWLAMSVCLSVSLRGLLLKCEYTTHKKVPVSSFDYSHDNFFSTEKNVTVSKQEID